jgi:hypothetical protein
MATFRKLLMRFYCMTALKHWRKVNHQMKLGERFVAAVARAFYSKAFRRWNTQRLFWKASQFMLRIAGKNLRLLFTAWYNYLLWARGENGRLGLHANKALMKRCINKWRLEAKYRKILMNAFSKVFARKVVKAFNHWRTVAYQGRWAGTAVQWAFVHAYMRWAAQKWWQIVLNRRILRRGLHLFFRGSAIGMLTWGFSNLRLKPKKQKLPPRKIGFCTCVYKLCHGGHCTCSFDLHFSKRMANFSTVMTSSDDIHLKQQHYSRSFERDYDRAGLSKSIDVGASLASTALNVSLNSLRESGGTVRYDMNGRRVREKVIKPLSETERENAAKTRTRPMTGPGKSKKLSKTVFR